MKVLLWTVLAGALLFMGAGVAQEWPIFAAALAGKEPAPPEADPALKKQAAQAVKTFLSMKVHLYGSGFDKRFLERMPASQKVLDELRADMAYLRHRGWIQHPRLVRHQVLKVQPTGPDQLRVVTREFWIVRQLLVGTQRLVSPPASSVLSRSYLVKRAGSRWLVDGWQLAPAGAGAAARAAEPAAPPTKGLGGVSSGGKGR